MTELTIIESASESFTRVISSKIAAFGSDIFITRLLPSQADLRRQTDLVVVSPGSWDILAPGGTKLRCNILLAPGGIGASFARAGCVVTYGMSAKDSITMSSIGEDTCVLALQRELVTAGGRILERQELKIQATDTADELMASAGVMLLLGLPFDSYPL